MSIHVNLTKSKILVLLLAAFLVLSVVPAQAQVEKSPAAYDSGWVVVQANSGYSFEHGLGYRPLSVFIWVSSARVGPLESRPYLEVALPWTEVSGVEFTTVDGMHINVINNSSRALYIQVVAD